MKGALVEHDFTLVAGEPFTADTDGSVTESGSHKAGNSGLTMSADPGLVHENRVTALTVVTTESGGVVAFVFLDTNQVKAEALGHTGGLFSQGRPHCLTRVV